MLRTRTSEISNYKRPIVDTGQRRESNLFEYGWKSKEVKDPTVNDDLAGGDCNDSSMYLSLLFGNEKEVSENVGWNKEDRSVQAEKLQIAELGVSSLLDIEESFEFNFHQWKHENQLMWLVDQVRMGEKLKREEYHDVLHRELVNFHRIFGYNTNLSARVCSEFVNKVQNNGAVRNESASDPGGLSKCWNFNWRTWLNCSKYLASTELVELGERAKVYVI